MTSGIRWNSTLEKLPFSPIRKMFNAAAEMEDVLHLSIGQPDFNGPPHVIEAHIRALHDGQTRYEMDAGLPALRQAVADRYNQLYEIDLQPTNVLITTGCCQAMFMTIHAITRADMEFIVTEPVFVFSHVIEQAGGVLRRIVTTAANGYQVDPQQLVDVMNDNTCAIMLNSPGNPTGAVYPAETLKPVLQQAQQRGIAVISDEVYDRLVLDDVEYPTALTMAPSLDNVFVTSSISKSYALPGLRIGWVISSESNILALQRMHMFISTTENTAAQHAAVEALQGDQSCVDQMVAAYRTRRNRLVEIMDSTPLIHGYSPGGAFFVMPSLPGCRDSFEFAMKMLREAKVCTIPGGAFGQSCNNALRISFATDLDTIERSMERMIPWLEKQSS
ncbi:MAG: aspartate aminotransferase [Planctomycetaceae bacterium]|jgi:aminotransferase|nr:aspartate aminotransferase [Planctomycetaceae bacterium]MBP61618.1 aspartate aminotransferase [Planctomycetaceae bacterium]